MIALQVSKLLRWSGLCLVLALMAIPRPSWAEAGVAAPEAATQVQLEAGADAPGDPSAIQDDQLQIRLSLPTESDREAWQKPGLRVVFGGSWQQFLGLYGAPSGNGFGAVVRIGARLDRDWSLLASFHYGGVSATKGLAGLRYAGTIDPTWHITPNFDLAVGMGVGGIVEGRGDRPEADLDELASLATSRTWASARTPFGVCQGAGLAGLVRGGWMTVLGPLSSLGISVELAGQWTACQQTTTRAEADTARPIVRRQWWAHSGAIAAMVFAWR